VHSRRNGKALPKLDKTSVRAVVTVDSKPSFDDLLLEAIDEAFSSLGKSVKAAIYFHLESTFGIKKNDIPSRITDFSDAIEKVLGTGARHLEILAMKNLHAKIEVTCKWPSFEWPLSKWIVPEVTFQEYVRLMQQNFEGKNENKIEVRDSSDEPEDLQLPKSS